MNDFFYTVVPESSNSTPHAITLFVVHSQTNFNTLLDREIRSTIKRVSDLFYSGNSDSVVIIKQLVF
jgi:hypothetical protein